MKNLSIVLLIALAACSKQSDNSSSASMNDTGEIRKESCNFGITRFNTKARPLLENQTMKPKPPGNGSGSAVILLDFNGHLVSNTMWTSYPLTCTGANLSATDMETILEHVSEDYRPFNITVTADEAVYNSANPAKRMRVVITETWEWYGMAGGTAFVNSFTWGNNTPCFVFSILLNYDKKKIAEAASHEAGHTLGLLHQVVYNTQCAFVSEYNAGIGTGETSWAPIMGNSHSRNMTLWHNGPNAYGCNTIQNEVNIISGITGLKPDDFTNSLSNAAPLNSTGTGCMNSSNDIDCFYIDIPEPSVITVRPNNLGVNNECANLDLVLKVYSRNRTLISVIDDPASLSVFTPTLSPERYYFSVETTVNQNAGRYGQLGKYFVTVE